MTKKEKVNISKLVDGEKISGHLVIEGLSKALADDYKFEKFAEDRRDGAGDVSASINLTIDGVEIDFISFCDLWEGQVDRMIREMAMEIIRDRFSDINDLLFDLKERLEPEIASRLEDWEKNKDGEPK